MIVDRRATLATLAALALSPLSDQKSSAASGRHAAAGGGEEPTIALLVYPGMTALDLVGPHHFLGGGGLRIEIVTTAKDLSPVPTDSGLAIQPTVTIETCAQDVLLLFVPGGTGGTIAAARDPRTIAFVRDRGARARYVTSVCTGSLVLGVAGLLKGKRATSHWIVRDALSRFEAFPTAGRVVRDGSVITAAGVSAGLDLGLILAAELAGRDAAERMLLVSEYDPEPPFPGGSPETARPQIVARVREGLARFVADAHALEIGPG